MDLVVLHFTGMDDLAEARARLCAPEHEVSCHYLVGRAGEVYAMVDEHRRAWHAGAGEWGGRDDVNSRSIGIEIDNDGVSPFAEPAMAALLPLLADILRRHDLPPEAVIGHQDMAPGRKDDPGPFFDWRRLAEAGLSVWPRPVPGPASATGFRADLARFGYPVGPGIGDEALLAAFHARFRPAATGFSPEDADLARDLAARWPARRATVA